MSRLINSSFFCEDFRTEDTGQPMIIGLLSREVEIDTKGRGINSLFFVSFFQANKKHSGITLRLTVEISHDEREGVISRGPFNRPLADGTELGDEDDLVVVSLPIDKVPLDVGTRIQATLEVGDDVQTYSLHIKEIEAV